MISTAEEMNPTRRNTMEDVHVHHAPSTWDAPDSNATYVGVYDGHGGRGIVDYLEDNLASNVAKEWCFENDKEGERKKRRIESEKMDRRADTAILTSLERAFLLTDIQSRMRGIQTSGATVACCVVVPKFSGGKLQSIEIHCANAGDARIVLSSNTARRCGSTTDAGRIRDATSKAKQLAVRLTHDHKATDPKEIERIHSSGGMMIRGRVLGVLAVARSLGDHGLKDFVIGRPFLSSTTVEIANNSVEGTNENKVGGWDKKSSLTDGEFLVVACDGLWDVMEDQEAVDMVRKFVVEDTREKEVARYLVDEALRRGSTDNITVIVYWL